MTKAELIKVLMHERSITKEEAETVVELFFGSMADAFVNGDNVQIRGLCSFILKSYRSYIGRNPKTGQSVEVNPKRMPFFRCGKELKDRINNREG